MGYELLLRLFRRHYADPRAALRRLDEHLAIADLPFDLKLQVRELNYPRQPDLPNGFQSWIYYFAPNSNRGSDQIPQEDPLHPSFLNATDGIGLNMGCPVRLLRALDALAQLDKQDQKSPKDNLRNAREHLSAVEELLWITGWKSPAHFRRGGQFQGLSGDVDWAFDVEGSQVFLEAKFRRSDWPRLSDHNTFLRTDEGFLSNALHKFPKSSSGNALHVVGITLFDNITEEIIDLVGSELAAAPQIHAVIFRSMIQMTHVLSLDMRVRNRVRKLLAIPNITDFPVDYMVPVHIESRDRRVSKRKQQRFAESQSGKPPRVFHWWIKPQGVKPPMLTDDPYKLDILSRGPDGEPNFVVVPKYLMPPGTDSSG